MRLFKTKLRNEKLWTSDFYLLWQGHLASALGDRLYMLAFGFWILAVSGSTALMGLLMAVCTLPRVVLAPFTNKIIERINKKVLLILTNIVRGLFLIFIGVAIIIGKIKIWMLFFAGLIIGLCGAIFTPTVTSAIPQIVPPSKVFKANSVHDMLKAGTSIFGNFTGGILFQILGAAQMFLFNGLSYLFSAFTGLFVEIPKDDKPKKVELLSHHDDLLILDWKYRGLRYLLITAACINFFGNIGLILFLPLFQKAKGFGANTSGLWLVFLTGSLFLGLAFNLIINIPPTKRLVIFLGSNVISAIGYAGLPFVGNYQFSSTLIFAIGLFNAMYNVFITSSIQLSVPENMRGKVFGLSGAVFSGMSPVAMAVGGFLAEFFSIKVIIFVSQMMSLLLIVPLAILFPIKKFINFDHERDSLEEVTIKIKNRNF